MPSELRLVEQFLEDVEHHFPEEHKLLVEALGSFIDLYRNRLISDRTAARTLRQLSTYLSRKAINLHPEAIARRAETLRSLRNRLTHGKRPSSAELKAGYDSLWAALLKGARKLNPKDLTNLLGYSLRTGPEIASKSHDQVRIVSAFRAVFRAMPPERQEMVFKELLIRLFSEPEFAEVLDPGGPRR